MRHSHRFRGLCVAIGIASSAATVTTASAQYGPRFRPGFGPGVGIGIGPGVAIGAIPRWSRRNAIPSFYPPIGFPGAAVMPYFAYPPYPAFMPVLPVPPVGPWGGPGSRIDVGPNHVDIRTPGFQYRSRLGGPLAPVLPPSQPSAPLSRSAARLAVALSVHPDGDVWLDYLQPERVASATPSQRAELSLRYRGVLANPDLAWLQRVDGFEETLDWLTAESEVGGSTFDSPGSLPGSPSRRRSNEPTLAPKLPSNAQPDSSPGRSPETLPAPQPEPTTSL